MVLACAEDREGLEQTTALVRRRTEAPIIKVRTKSDLVASSEGKEILLDAVFVSAETGSGLRNLLGAIDGVIDADQGQISPDLPILTSARHRTALEVARGEVVLFSDAWRAEKLPVTIAAVHLRTAVSELEELIGAFEVDDVLDRVFSSFCVGK